MTTTDATRATAVALPEISRRRFLFNTTVAGAAVAVAAPVATAEPEMHPLERLHVLHDEASKLMAVHNEHMGGEWELRIRAPQDRMPVTYKNIGHEHTPLEQAEWHLRELARLIAEDGGEKATIVAVANYGDNSGYRGIRGFSLKDTGKIVNDDGMFAAKGGVA